MNTYNVNDSSFKNSKNYQDFLKDNPKIGYLNIRAYAANQAIPISGLKITISTLINNSKVIFFEGLTNSSGTIERIKLPAPSIIDDNLNIPKSISYTIDASYPQDNFKEQYKTNIYENLIVIQNIIVGPNMNMFNGDVNGN